MNQQPRQLTRRVKIGADGRSRLCEESSQSRRDSGHFGTFTAAQRLEVASRIAAYTVFCGCNAIETGLESLSGAETLTVRDLGGGFEHVRDDRFDVSENAVRETLATTLFSGRGPQRLGFAHRTYAEFLAARYVTHRKLDATQTGTLIFHAETTTRIVPQLAETAAWIAVAERQIFDRMRSCDPQSLIRSDVTTADAAVKAQLVQKLVEGMQSEDLDDSEWSLRDHYRKLTHPDLANQIEPLIRDKSQNTVTRRFVIDLAEECRETRLLSALASVALDQTDDPHIRSQASHAIVAIGDDAAIGRLKPLALGDAGSDPDDELRGSAMKGMWSRGLISADELFSALIKPKRESFGGAYWHFIHYEISRHLAPSDLPCALEWCSRIPQARGHHDVFENAIAEIAQQALSRLNEPEVLNAFADYVVSRITQHDELPIENEDLALFSVDDRRRIASAVLGKLDDPEKHSYRIIYGEPTLTNPDDLAWFIEQSLSADSPEKQRQWAQLARCRFLHGGLSQIDYVLNCCEANAILSEVFADLFQAVDLNSEKANALKARYNQSLELDERMHKVHERPLLDPPPQVRVASSLERFESGNLNGWWHLNRELQLEPQSSHYEHDFIDDITQLPGWSTADEETRQRILSAAKKYLTEWQSAPDEWVGTNTFHYRDFSGYRALVLVEKLEPLFLRSLNTERWSQLAPPIIGYPTCSGGGDQTEERQKRLVAAAYEHASDSIITNLLRIIDRENSDQNPHLFVLRRAEQCWDDKLRDALLAKARDGSLKPSSLGDLLTALVEHCCPAAVGFAKSLISPRSDEATRESARQAAVVIWMNGEGRGWEVLWPEFQSDRQFFRDVVSDIAHERRQFRRPPSELSEDQLADLFILLAEEFPPATDPIEEGAHAVGPRESVKYYRDGILTSLRDRGTLAACAAIERIKEVVPQVEYLGWTLRAAKRTTLQATWTPLSPEQLRGLTNRPTTRLVRDGRELQQVILESLRRLQQRLHGETPAVRDLWDYAPKTDWRPVDENDLSNYIKRHLETDLRDCGIVALREVEIRRGYDARGERTDIYVAAVVPTSQPSGFETVRIIIEVKGCWHPELRTAMESQLKNRYLKDNDCEHGVYVVGWFACEPWSVADSRREKTPKWTVTEARKFFETQTASLSDAGNEIAAFVLDTSLV